MGAAIAHPPLPPLIGVIPQPAGCFVVRGVADDLDRALQAEQTGVAVLSGLGGAGKTQLAAEYAWRALDDPEVGLVAWINASSRDAVLSGYARASPLYSAGDNHRTDQDAERFLTRLATFEQPWLIVLDDLTRPDHIVGLWPPEGPHGRTLVTTRRRDAAFLRNRHLVNVGVYAESEAAAYLNAALADHPELADEVNGVAHDLGLLPLALSHAAAYMIDHRLSCSQYRLRFQDRWRESQPRRSTSELFPGQEELPDNSTKTIAVTWSLSVEGANRLRPVGLAKPLLELASVLAPQGIPETVFTTSAARRWLTSKPPGTSSLQPIVDQDTARDGLHCLRRFNLASLDAGTIGVHSLVQRVTRDEIGSNLDEIVLVAADALTEAWPDVEPDPKTGQLLRANAETLTGGPSEATTLWNPAVHPLLLRAGRSLGESGQAKAAFDYFDQLHTTARRRRGDTDPGTLATRHGRARWRGAAGDPGGAVHDFGTLLTDTRRLFGPRHHATLAARGSLAYWQGMEGHPQVAADAFDELLADMERLYPPDNRDLLATRHGRAWWHGMAGDCPGAADAFDELLADMERLYPPDDRDLLATRHGRAWSHGIAGDPQRAAGALKQLAADTQRLLGADHPATLTAQGNLHYWQGMAGHPADTATALRKLVADTQRVLGTDHPVTLATRSNLIHWQAATGDRAGATTALRELAANTQRALGTDHPITRGVLAYRQAMASGTPAEAAIALQELLASRVPVLGPAHPSAATDHYLAEMIDRPRPGGATDLISLVTKLALEIAGLNGSLPAGAASIRLVTARNTVDDLTEILIKVIGRHGEKAADAITYFASLEARIRLREIAKILQMIGQHGTSSSALDDAAAAIEQLQRAVRAISIPPPAP